MSASQAVPIRGEEVTAHSTLFTTEVDQRTDTGPWATWRREVGTAQELSSDTRQDCQKKLQTRAMEEFESWQLMISW